MEELETVPVNSNPSEGGQMPANAAAAGVAAMVQKPGWTEARRLALKQLDKLVGQEPKVLRGNRPDAVHALRVASRRLQEELDLLYSKPRPPEIRRVRRKIRRCRGILSGLRNCDVLLARTQNHLAASRSTRRQAWETVTAFLHERRQALFSKAVHKLTRINLPEIYLELREHLIRPDKSAASSWNGDGPFEPQAQSHPGPPLQERLAEELNRRCDEFERQAGKANQNSGGESLHPSRIAAKKLRYLIEIAAEFKMDGSQQALNGLKNLQTILGGWHDLEMSEIMLTEIVGNAKFIRDNLARAPWILRLIEQERKSKERLKHKAMEVLQKAVSDGAVRAWINSLQ
ncbi:MAG TPA: CHAD domain-containing protein [Terriglobia bacterium]|nr:CHAD domain-containing protein [Terriglobia bacterium]